MSLEADVADFADAVDAPPGLTKSSPKFRVTLLVEAPVVVLVVVLLVVVVLLCLGEVRWCKVCL